MSRNIKVLDEYHGQYTFRHLFKSDWTYLVWGESLKLEVKELLWRLQFHVILGKWKGPDLLIKSEKGDGSLGVA